MRTSQPHGRSEWIAILPAKTTGMRRIASHVAAYAIALGLFAFVAPAAAQPALVTVRVGLVPSDDITPVVYAVRTGLFAKAGLDVQILKAASGAVVAAAVVAGSFEIGESSLVSLMNAHLRGVPVALIAAGGVYEAKAPHVLFAVAADSPYKAAKDLDGRTIGVPSLNDLNQVVTEAWVDKSGGDSTTLKFVEFPNAAAEAGLIEHRIDGYVLFNPSLAAALTNGKIRILGAAHSAVSDYFMEAGWFASTAWADKHPEIVKTFARVTAQAAAYTNAHHAETAPMLSQVTGIPPAVVEKMVRTDTALTLNPADIQPLIDVAAKYKMIPHPFPAADLIYAGSATK